MIGNKFSSWRKLGESKKSPVMYVCDVIINSAELAKTTFDQLQLSENAKSSGATLTLGRHEEPGKKQEWKLILKTPTRNGGMATETRNMLLSMNLKEKLHSVTFPDGSIVIQTIWRLKEEPQQTNLPVYGSPQMWTQDCGTPKIMNNNKLDCCEDLTSPISEKKWSQYPMNHQKHWEGV